MMINATQNNTVNNNAVLVNVQAARQQNQPAAAVQKNAATPAAVYQPSTLSDYNGTQLSPLQKKIVSLQNQIHSLQDGKPLSQDQRKDLINNLNHYLKNLQDGDSGQSSNQPLTPQQMHQKLAQEANNLYDQVQSRINNPYSYLAPDNSGSSNPFSFAYGGNGGNVNNIFSTLSRGMDALQNNQLNQALQSLSNRLDSSDDSNTGKAANGTAPQAKPMVPSANNSDPYSFINGSDAGVTNSHLTSAARNRLAIANIYHNAMSNLSALPQAAAHTTHSYNRLA